MTLLNISHNQKQVLVFSDTLALSADDHFPFNFLPKVFSLPHINSLITVTGVQQLLFDALTSVIGRIVYQDVEALSEFLPDQLNVHWSNLKNTSSFEGTTTVYLFGSNSDGIEMLGFAFRSVDNFVAEPLGYGQRTKPAPRDFELPNSDDFFKDQIKIAVLQQREDRALPISQRIGIGGDLLLYALTLNEDGKTYLQTQHLCELPHKQKDWDLIVARLPTNDASYQSSVLIEEYILRPW
jgi:hypothetical protein